LSKPFNPHRPHGIVSPPTPFPAADGNGMVSVLFEQEGRLYGAAPDYRRALAAGQKVEDDVPYRLRKGQVVEEPEPERPPVRQNRAVPPKPKKAKPKVETQPAPAPKGESTATGRYKNLAEAKSATKSEAGAKKGAADLDLAAWARGEVKVPFAKVRAAVVAQFDGETVSDEDEAMEFLARQGVIPPPAVEPPEGDEGAGDDAE
jgi:hypothetical protein